MNESCILFFYISAYGRGCRCCIALHYFTRYLIIDGENMLMCVLANGREEMHHWDKWLEQVYTKHSILECTIICVNFLYIFHQT